ncbi:hypothetical protein AAG906_019256 [Vitis piasezkii]
MKSLLFNRKYQSRYTQVEMRNHICPYKVSIVNHICPSQVLIVNHICPSLYGHRCYSTKDTILEKFWESFYSQLLDDMKIHSRSESNVSQYHKYVIDLLNNSKKDKDSFTEEELISIQTSIEDATFKYDDVKNIYQLTPDLIKIIISKDELTAKEFLKKCKLTKNDLLTLEYFDQYTLEAIIIYVLGVLFNCIQELPAVRVSTLIEHLDTYVRSQAKLFKGYTSEERPSTKHKINEDDTSSNVKAEENEMANDKMKNNYAFGVFLVEFLVSRKWISLSNELNFHEQYSITMKNGKYYIPRQLYAICNFDISLLPIKLNLPMICKPLDWKPIRDDIIPSSLSDMRGGYLSIPSGDFYQQKRYRVMTTRDLSHFHIKFDECKYDDLCLTMNKLQAQSFEVHKDVLSFIMNNNELLVKYGLLMPGFLASLNINRAVELLRNSYLSNNDLTQVCNYQDLLKVFLERIQRARYETFVINIASAYEGYKIYLPAFVDFRGRIYRAGVLHFHERDLARSLVLFTCNNPSGELINQNIDDKQIMFIASAAAAFHYKKFESYKDSYQWYLDHVSMKASSAESIIKLALSAADPYQFISKVLCIESNNKSNLIQIPITQDASASAYQIMSYFLLDNDLALKTNLIPYIDYICSPECDFSDNKKIKDIYTILLEELKVYFRKELTNNLADIVCPRLTRKLVKVLFMPMIYGKTVISIANDFNQHFDSLLDKGECMQLAKKIYIFYKTYYPGIVNLMDLIRNISWLVSAMDRPVLYSVSLFTTVQDYMKSKTVNIWVYDRIHRKRRQVTLRIPSGDRDRRKTHMSTFANFIHQKDAFIAMHMIKYMVSANAPVYTVHDNFITTAPYASYISGYYYYVLYNMGCPLLWINQFIDLNLAIDRNSYTLESPIPTDILYNSLESIIPKNLNKSKKIIWYNKILSVSIAYDKYIKDLSDNNPKTGYLNKKRAEFISNMLNWENCKYKYCLHL